MNCSVKGVNQKVSQNVTCLPKATRLTLTSGSNCTRPLGPKAMNASLLIVDDEKTTREGLRSALEDRFDVYLAEDAKAAAELLEQEHFDVLLTDFRLPN